MLAELSKKKDNAIIKTKKQYEETMVSMEAASKKRFKERSHSEKYLMKKYRILKVGEDKRIIRKESVELQRPKVYVFFKEIYAIVLQEHNAIGHGRRDRTKKRCDLWYENITYEAVNLFLSCCLECAKLTKTNTISNMVIKPVRSSDALSRTQIDLIDLQTFPDGDFKWIMTVQDHVSKFVNLRALKQKRAIEVATQLNDIFLTFGSPCILQSDNGKEFRASVVEQVRNFWPELKIVHGRPHHPESQGSVERANGEVKRLLGVWIRTTGRKDWTTGIKVVQFQYNSAHNKNLDNSPFKVMFGIDPPLGLQSTVIPRTQWEGLSTETDLTNVLNNGHDESDAEEVAEVDNDFGNELQHAIEESNKENEIEVEPIKPIKKRGRKKKEIDIEREAPPRSPSPPLIQTRAKKRVEATSQIREKTNGQQEKVARKMIEKTNNYLVPVKVGDKVIFFTDELDRGITDAPNLLCKINAIKHDNYELASEAGIIDRLVPRNAFHIAAKNIDFTVKTDTTITVRSAITAL